MRSTTSTGRLRLAEATLKPTYAGGRPPKFTLPQWRQIKMTALARPTDHGLPLSTHSRPLEPCRSWPTSWWRRGCSTTSATRALRLLLREEGVSFQAVKTWKTGTDPDYEVKKNRVLELYPVGDSKAEPDPHDPTVVICIGR